MYYKCNIIHVMYIMNIPCIMNIPRMYIIQTAPFKICLDIELNVNFLGRKYHIIPPSLYVVYIIYTLYYTRCILPLIVYT